MRNYSRFLLPAPVIVADAPVEPEACWPPETAETWGPWGAAAAVTTGA